MAYTKQTWNCGDVISAEKLNHMEDGIAEREVMIVNITQRTGQTTYEMDHTGEEIIDWIDSGKIVRLVEAISSSKNEFYLYEHVENTLASFYNIFAGTYSDNPYNIQQLKIKHAFVSKENGNVVNIGDYRDISLA